MNKISTKDMIRLQGLAGTVAELAARPEQARKAKLWLEHNDLHTNQPLIFCDPENGWNEIITPESLGCEGDLARFSPENEISLRKNQLRSRRTRRRDRFLWLSCIGFLTNWAALQDCKAASALQKHRAEEKLPD